MFVPKFEYFQAIWIGVLLYVWHAGNIIPKAFLKYVQKVDFYLIIGCFILVGRSSKSVSCAQFSYFLWFQAGKQGKSCKSESSHEIYKGIYVIWSK